MSADLLEPADTIPTEALSALAGYTGGAREFWPLYLQALIRASGARRALVLGSAVGRPWQALAQWPPRGAEDPEDAQRSLRLLTPLLPQVCHLQTEGGQRHLVLQPPLADGTPTSGLLAVLVLQLPENGREEAWLAWARAAAELPAQCLRHAALADEPEPAASTLAPVTHDAELAQALERAQRLQDTLELSQALARQTRFLPAAMTLCNRLCTRFGADRVSLAWRRGHGLRLSAISHIEHFDAKSNVTRALEEAMDEAAEQESVLLFPAPGQDRSVLRAHQTYASMAAPAQAQPRLCTVPLQGPDGVTGALCLERMAQDWSPAELWELQQVGQAVTPWLGHLHAQDRWFGLRWWAAAGQSARNLLGPRHTAWKASGLAAVLFLLAGSVLPWSYRVDATLAVRSQDLLFMPAPFDGYLRQVHVDVGDQVAAGSVLVELDTRDLVLEESMAEADVVRFGREAEKAMAARQLAEMQIALARQQQAGAKLELTRFQLAHAQVRAPYEGVVIEGELKKNLGAPVRKGDLLLKLARTTQTFLELEIDQAYVHEVAPGTRGEFALVGRPAERYPIRLTQIDPAAVTKEGRTVYLARAVLEGPQKPDWRPGMGGNAKLDAGQRPLIWVLTHRTVRFLREFFWL